MTIILRKKFLFLKWFSAIILTVSCATHAKAQYHYSYIDSAEVYIKQEKWIQAENALINALRTAPDNYNNSLILSNLATIQRIQGKKKDAVNNYSLALTITPNAVTLLNNRGQLYMEMDSTELAKKDFLKVMELDEKDVPSRCSMATILIRQGKPDEAHILLNDVKRINAKRLEYREALALYFEAKEKYEDAIGQYDELLKSEPIATWHTCKAECYIALKDYSKAKDELNEALKIDPSDSYLYLLKAKINKRQFQNDEMSRNMELAVRYGLSRKEVEEFIANE